ncbi:MAG: hypothetical protein MUF15_27335 [Acidobacteria bacterium]|nr:hypothetical protein [Acidobacteriota bacterium]
MQFMVANNCENSVFGFYRPKIGIVTLPIYDLASLNCNIPSNDNQVGIQCIYLSRDVF